MLQEQPENWVYPLTIADFDTLDCGTDLLLALSRQQVGEDEQDTVSKVYKLWENAQPKEAQTDLGRKRYLEVSSPTPCSPQGQLPS